MLEERQDTRESTWTLRDLLVILFKHKLKIGIVFFAIVVAVTAVSFFLPPIYEAKSSVLVKFGREYLYRPEVGEKNPVISYGQTNQEEILNSEIEIIASRDLMGKVIDAVGLENLYPSLSHKSFPPGITRRDAAIVHFGKMLSVEGVKKSNVMKVSFRHEDPRLAARVVNLLVDFFKEKHLQVYSDPQSSFLDKQLTEYRRRLEESENSLQTFKQTQSVYSLDEQRRLMLDQRMRLDNTYKETQNIVRALKEKLRSLRMQIKALSEDGNTFAPSEQGNIITETKAKLLQLQLKEQDLLVRYKEEIPLLRDVRKQIQMTKDFLKEQEKDVTSKVRTGNVVFQEAEKERVKSEADLNAHQARLASLAAQIARVDVELRRLDGKEKRFLELKRDAASNEKNYQNYLEKFEEARISEDMNRKKMANISVVQAAAVPMQPVKPKRMFNIIAAILLGAAIALGLAFLSEYLGHTFNTAQDVEKRLGLPVLTAVTRQRA